MSQKVVALLLLIVLGMALVYGQNGSTSPATGKAVSADVNTEDIQYDAQGHVISKTTVKGISIQETGSGYDPSMDKSKGYTVPIRPGKGSVTSPPVEGGNQITVIWQTIMGIGSLQFLFGDNAEGQLCGFLRIIMAILIFTLLYMGLSLIPGLTKGTAITIAIILSIVSAIFMPCPVLLAWGTTYATIVAFFVVFGPVLAGGMLLLGTATPNRTIAFLKLVIVLILMWLVGVIGTWAGTIGGQ